jgi:phosphohistidine phosphatase SixA
MERYIHEANIVLYRHLIAESACNSKRDEDRHKTLLGPMKFTQVGAELFA